MQKDRVGGWRWRYLWTTNCERSATPPLDFTTTQPSTWSPSFPAIFLSIPLHLARHHGPPLTEQHQSILVILPDEPQPSLTHAPILILFLLPRTQDLRRSRPRSRLLSRRVQHPGCGCLEAGQGEGEVWPISAGADRGSGEESEGPVDPVRCQCQSGSYNPSPSATPCRCAVAGSMLTGCRRTCRTSGPRFTGICSAHMSSSSGSPSRLSSPLRKVGLRV